MNTKKVIVHTNTIDDFAKDVHETSSTLTEILDDLLELTKDLDKHFNTPTGKEFKEFLIKYMTDSKNDCKALDNFGNFLNKASSIYKDAKNNASQEVGGQNG